MSYYPTGNDSEPEFDTVKAPDAPATPPAFVNAPPPQGAPAYTAAPPPQGAPVAAGGPPYQGAPASAAGTPPQGEARDRFGLPMNPDAGPYGTTGGAVWGQPASSTPLKGIIAGAVVGLLAAIAYAAIMVFTEREFFMAAVGIGIVIGWAVGKFWGRSGVLAGLVAAALTAVAYCLAAAFFMAGIEAKLGTVDFWEMLGEIFQYPAEYAEAYVEADGLVVLFFFIAVIAAFIGGFSTGNKTED